MNNTIFWDLKVVSANDRDSTKKVEKPYFHYGPQAQMQYKVISTTSRKKWKLITITIIIIIIIIIMTKIKLLTMKTIAI